tara:strand:+ start:182 stop:418 length:237 start_codon:yes stop_codon:yes gene_type:complete
MIFINEGVDFGSWSWDIPKKMVMFSPNWFKSLGCPIPQNLNQDIATWEKLIHPDDKNLVMKFLNMHYGEQNIFLSVRK